MISQASLDQMLYTVRLDLRQDMKAHLEEEARQVGIENAYGWARTISDRYSMAVYSLVTARYEDVGKDIRRERLTLTDATIIIAKLVELKAIDQSHATIWLSRMPVTERTE